MSKQTLAQAQALVESYVQPAKCFVVYKNNAEGWDAIEGTPCAHYVSHILGIRSRAGGYGCNEGCEIRVRALVKQLTEVELEDVQVNSVWARLKGNTKSGGGVEPSDHCGIVIKVDKKPDGSIAEVTIRHDSSGQHKVAENQWTTYFGKGGKFYKAPTQAVVPPSSQASMLRASRGLPVK